MLLAGRLRLQRIHSSIEIMGDFSGLTISITGLRQLQALTMDTSKFRCIALVRPYGRYETGEVQSNC